MTIKLLVPSVLSVELAKEQTIGRIYPKVKLGDGVQRQYSRVAPSFEYENVFQTGWLLMESGTTTRVKLPSGACDIKVNTASIVDIVRHQPQTPFADIPLKLVEVTHLDETTEIVLVSESSLASLVKTPECLQLAEENFVDVQAIKSGDTVLLGRQSYVVTTVVRTEHDDFADIRIEFSLKSALNKKTTNTYTVHYVEHYSSALYRETTGQEDVIPFLKYLYFMRGGYAQNLHSVHSRQHFSAEAQQLFSASLTQRLSELLRTEDVWIELDIDRVVPPGCYSYSTVSHLLRWSGLSQVWESFSENAITRYFATNAELLIGDLSTSVIWNNAENQYPEFVFHVQVKRARKKGFYTLKSEQTAQLYQHLIGDMPKELTAFEVARFIQTIGERTLLCTRKPQAFIQTFQQLGGML